MPISPALKTQFYQIIRFGAVGLSGTLIQYISLGIGVEFLSINAPISSSIGYVLGSVANYILNYFFTFNSTKSHQEAATKYFFVVGIGWCLNLGLMTLMTHRWLWYYWIAQFISTGIVFSWNFAGS